MIGFNLPENWRTLTPNQIANELSLFDLLRLLSQLNKQHKNNLGLSYIEVNSHFDQETKDKHIADCKREVELLNDLYHELYQRFMFKPSLTIRNE